MQKFEEVPQMRWAPCCVEKGTIDGGEIDNVIAGIEARKALAVERHRPLRPELWL